MQLIARYLTTTIVLSYLAAVAHSSAGETRPPVAKVAPHCFEEHGCTRVDDYFWLHERDNPDVLNYLRQENDYTEEVMRDVKALEERLFEETKGRIKQDDSSVPYADRGYVYYTRFEEGRQYPIYCRRVNQPDAPEQVMLDVNELAGGHPFCSVLGVSVSSGSDKLAYATDFVGRRIYTIRFKDLATGKMLQDKIPNVTGNLAWAEDNETLFYARQDPVTLRSFQIFRHKLGTESSQDRLVFQEDDETFTCFVFKSRSRDYIMIGSEQTLSGEYRFVDAHHPEQEFQIIAPRERNHEYSVDHVGDHFYVRTNWNAENFRLMRAPDLQAGRANWSEVIPHRVDVFLDSFELFRDYLVVAERSGGLIHLRVLSRAGPAHELDFGEPAYSAGTDVTPDPDTDWLRYNYTSLTTPASVYEYNMKTREKRLLKQTPVLGGFNAANYRAARLWAPARDGAAIPVSLVHHKDTPINGTAPCLLYGYGSYGASLDASFDSTRLNLLDRGFVFAIAHVRGGQELGRSWYEDGRLLKKKNSFTDFLDVARYLIQKRYADPKRLFAHGGSAGGLLVGAVVNIEPDLFCGVVADVPFVDVVTTMFDASIPLTTNEYDEWGDPHEETYYKYMLSYSPYDNVRAVRYPHLLVTTSLHDSQVQYWEPAKWVARLRATKTDDNLLLLKTNMDAGHGGASGRFDRYREVAFRHAFLLKLAGLASEGRAVTGTKRGADPRGRLRTRPFRRRSA